MGEKRELEILGKMATVAEGMAKMIAERGELLDRVKEMEAEVHQLRVEQANLLRVASTSGLERDTLIVKVKGLQAANDATNSDFDQMAKVAGELKAERDTLRDRVAELETELKRWRRVRSSLTDASLAKHGEVS